MMRVSILGTRGIPAAHGGFETFAERLSLYLVGKGWQVTVYCQTSGTGNVTQDWWRGVRRVFVPVKAQGALGTIIFDAKAVLHATRAKAPCLVLGYNTAIFGLLPRLLCVSQLINMDGIEWKRQKWGVFAKLWFYCNEIAGGLIGNHLVADHPQIVAHLRRHVRAQKITMIPYGGDKVTNANIRVLDAYGLSKGRFSIVIARPEPENSILEIVQSFSAVVRHHTLVVVGQYRREVVYQRRVLEAASDEVMFPGAIYDSETIRAFRRFSRLYVHGHQVGGTNPALVEAMGAGCAIVAHDNRFNRWVAGSEARYFSSREQLERLWDDVLSNDGLVHEMRVGSASRFDDVFQWERALRSYEVLMEKLFFDLSK